MLTWIKNNPNKWKPFISNQIAEIQGITNPALWFHCPGKDNSADLVTRGMFGKELMNSESWIRGPEWLSSAQFQTDNLQNDSKIPLEEENTVYNENSNIESTMVTLNLVKENYIDIERWEHLEKAIRVMGWILRFLNNSSSISSNRKNGDLTLRSFIRLNLSYSALFRVSHSPVRQLPIQEGSRVPKL